MSRNNEGKPGIMIYFDLLEPLAMLSNAEKGVLLQMMLEYGKTGIEPEIKRTKMVEIVWAIVKMRLDFDDETYRTKVARSKYAAYVRWSQKKGNTVLDYDAWLKSGGLEEENSYLDASDATA